MFVYDEPGCIVGSGGFEGLESGDRDVSLFAWTVEFVVANAGIARYSAVMGLLAVVVS